MSPDKYFEHKIEDLTLSVHVLLNLLNELGIRDEKARLAEPFIAFSQQV